MSYVRIWVRTVFGTKNREPLLRDNIKIEIINHIEENANSKDVFLDSINGVEDHIHCLLSLNADQSISKVAQLIKGESSFWINRDRITKTKFGWADEYFATSVSESQINSVRNYIKN